MCVKHNDKCFRTVQTLCAPHKVMLELTPSQVSSYLLSIQGVKRWDTCSACTELAVPTPKCQELSILAPSHMEWGKAERLPQTSISGLTYTRHIIAGESVVTAQKTSQTRGEKRQHVLQPLLR